MTIVSVFGVIFLILRMYAAAIDHSIKFRPLASSFLVGVTVQETKYFPEIGNSRSGTIVAMDARNPVFLALPLMAGYQAA